MSLLSLNDVQLNYGPQVLLDRVQLAIEPGERLCLVGRNGAGKSTLMRLIMGEVQPDGGRVTRRDGLRLAMLEQAGARLVFFSPLADDRLPEDIDGIYLCGGYPELSAGILSQKTALMSEINAHSRHQMPIFAECGGFMFLCRTRRLADSDQPVPMAGCFDLDVAMSVRLRSLGYREVTLTRDTVIGNGGDRVRGHEFHYSSVTADHETCDQVFLVTSRAGQDVQVTGYQKYQTLGSYLHVHFGSNPAVARTFADRCSDFRQQRTKAQAPACPPVAEKRIHHGRGRIRGRSGGPDPAVDRQCPGSGDHLFS